MRKLMLLVLVLMIALPTALWTHEKDVRENWIRDMEEAYLEINDYTAIFHKQERINGKLCEEEMIFIKFKKPFKVYLKWIKDPYKGREALYVEGWNENRMVIYESGVIGGVTVNLDSKGFIAMKGNRHPITESGFGHLIKLLGVNIRRGIRNDEFALQEQGEEVVYGRMTQRFELIFPKEKAKKYYCFRAVINLDSEMKIPLRFWIYDWDNVLTENYGYEDLKINPGLIDTDFDPKNPKYKFY
jgi:outer membrane lipoprotein-sorting protein